MPTLAVGMFRRFLAILMPTTSVGMPPFYDLLETLRGHLAGDLANIDWKGNF
jgi:hypothetical protein